ncbi:hypothetical protein LguiA_008868 [Lonicera macranthoides]
MGFADELIPSLNLHNNLGKNLKHRYGFADESIPSFNLPNNVRESPKHRRAKFGFAYDSIPSFNLPDEISMYVFSKLPVNSILCCRCVCKQWRRLLSDPEFVRLHLNHSLNCQKFLLRCGFKSYYLVDYEPSRDNCDTLRRDFPLESRHPPRVLGSCNGLLCVGIDHVKDEGLHPNNHKIVLWNPSIGDYKILPDTNPLINTSGFLNRYQLIGFGYDSSIRDYKIVRVLFGSRYQVDVYSLKTNSWKVIESGPLTRFEFSLNTGGTAANGSIYWLVHHRKHGICHRWMVSFDLKHDKLVELQLPPLDLHGFYSSVFLMEMGGCLGVYCYYWNEGDATFAVLWMMKKGKKDEWTKMTSISCYDSGRICCYLTYMNPLCCFENGKVLFYFADSDTKIKQQVGLQVYDPKLNSLVKTLSFYGISNFHELLKHTHSLVSPNAFVL